MNHSNARSRDPKKEMFRGIVAHDIHIANGRQNSGKHTGKI
jgi:hypothetical protein